LCFLFVGDHFAQIGDVLLDSGDSLRPGAYALIWDSGGILSFRFGKSDEGVLQFLFECGTVHMRRVSLERACMLAAIPCVEAILPIVRVWAGELMHGCPFKNGHPRYWVGFMLGYLSVVSAGCGTRVATRVAVFSWSPVCR
jgi:hypothetical protein